MPNSSNLSVGPSSVVRLDKFVYDPNRGSGSIAIEASRGAFRFATGSQNKGDYKVKNSLRHHVIEGSTWTKTGEATWDEVVKATDTVKGALWHNGDSSFATTGRQDATRVDRIGNFPEHASTGPLRLADAPDEQAPDNKRAPPSTTTTTKSSNSQRP